MLSTGKYLTTSEYQNSDLFWALRGGGGGTYGIETSVTLPHVPLSSAPGLAIRGKYVQFFCASRASRGACALPNPIYGRRLGWIRRGIQPKGSISSTFAPNMTNETVTTTTQAWLNVTQSLAPYCQGRVCERNVLLFLDDHLIKCNTVVGRVAVDM